MKKNIWGIGMAVILLGALGTMWYAGRNSSLPSPTSQAKETLDLNIDENSHIKGASNPKVTIVEWSDFQCPACRTYYPILNQVIQMFPNDVRVVYKHFPLKTIHIGAVPSARAAEAAAKQGKFWEMHNVIFDNQSSWANNPLDSIFEKYAQDLGLNLEKFKADLDSEEIMERVESDFKLALELGLNSTPTFYLNGKKIQNPSSAEAFAALIKAELANANNQ